MNEEFFFYINNKWNESKKLDIFENFQKKSSLLKLYELLINNMKNILISTIFTLNFLSFTLTKNKISYKYNFYNIFSLKNINNFIFGQNLNLKISNSQFKLYLNNLIFLNNLIEKNLTINERKIYLKNKIKIIKCSFFKCIPIEKNINGGAIFIDNKEGSTLILKSIFSNCKSTGNGGSIYINNDLININMTCIEESRATLFGQSIYLISPTLSISEVLISNCGSKKKKGSYTTYLEKCEIDLIFCNISNNPEIQNFCGLNLIDSELIDFKFSTFNTNFGNGLIKIFNCDEGSSFQKINFINNTIGINNYFFNLKINGLIIKKCYFFNNDFENLTNNFNINFILCKFDFNNEYLINLSNSKCKFEYNSFPPIITYQYNQCSLKEDSINKIFIPNPTKSLLPTIYIPPSTIDWVPEGMIIKEFGLLIFASIIIPIFLIIHCISSKDIRNIKALN